MANTHTHTNAHTHAHARTHTQTHKHTHTKPTYVELLYLPAREGPDRPGGADVGQTERGQRVIVLVGGEGVVLQGYEKYDEGAERAL